jgi:hypothetical protein
MYLILQMYSPSGTIFSENNTVNLANFELLRLKQGLQVAQLENLKGGTLLCQCWIPKLPTPPKAAKTVTMPSETIILAL